MNIKIFEEHPREQLHNDVCTDKNCQLPASDKILSKIESKNGTSDKNSEHFDKNWDHFSTPTQKKALNSKKMLKLVFFIDDNSHMSKLKALVNNKQLMHLRRHNG